jgi:hypothetical protein
VLGYGGAGGALASRCHLRPRRNGMGATVYQFSFSSQRFTDWPPMNSQGTSQLWNIMGQGSGNEALTLMLEDGYIRPKS